MEARACFLYRAFCQHGTLLYVGVATNLRGRMFGHRGRSPWYPAMEMVIAEKMKSRAACLEAEATAIIAEGPLFNKHHNQKMSPKRAKGDPFNPTWERACCRKPIYSEAQLARNAGVASGKARRNGA